MKRSSSILAALAMAAVFSFSGCAQKATMVIGLQATAPGGGLPRSVEGISARSMSRAPAVPLVVPVIGKDGVKHGDLTITEAFMAVKNIQIELEPSQVNSSEEQEQEITVEYPGPFLVNLITGVSNPDFPAIGLLPGAYDEIELAIDRLDGSERAADGTPLASPGSPMYGQSLYLTGRYTGRVGGADYTDLPFVLAYDIDESFDLSGTDPVVSMAFESGSLNSIIIAFRLVQWFDFSKAKTNPGLAVDFSALTLGSLGGAPAIVLDGSANGSNVAIREVIEENIEESADFGEDADGDGYLSPSEDDDPSDPNDL